MANIRIRDLPNASPPVKTDWVPLDLTTTRKATIEDIVNVGRPFASQAQAEAGTDFATGMNPLTTHQAILAQIPVIAAPFTARNTSQGRLSLSAVDAAPAADISGTTIYLRPMGGSMIPIYDGTKMVWLSFGTGLTLPLDANTGHSAYAAVGFNYDLFVMLIGGVPRLVFGPSWATGSVLSPNVHKERSTGTGATEIETVDGIPVNKNAITVRFGTSSGDIVALAPHMGTYVGSFRATADGTATDSARRRLLYNAYNQTIRPLRRSEASSPWAYSTATYRQMNGSATNQVEVLFGLTGTMVDLEACLFVSNSTTTIRDCIIGIGIDSATFPTAFAYVGAPNVVGSGSCRLCEYPGLGYSVFPILERGAGTDTQTWWDGSGMKGVVLI